MLTVRPVTLPGGLPVGAVSSYSLSLELVGSNDVCQRHHLVLVNGQEVLGDVLKEQGTRLVHAAGGVEPDTAPGAPLCATRRGTWSRTPAPGPGPLCGRAPDRSPTMWAARGDHRAPGVPGVSGQAPLPRL